MSTINSSTQQQPQQVYATIRPGTRYEAQCSGEAFPVTWQPSSSGYYWKGGPGGQYRHSDLALYIQNDSKLIPLPMFHSEEDVQVINTIISDLERSASAGRLYPEWFSQWTDELIQRLQQAARTAIDKYPRRG